MNCETDAGFLLIRLRSLNRDGPSIQFRPVKLDDCRINKLLRSQLNISESLDLMTLRVPD
jgi:hypothetical protein